MNRALTNTALAIAVSVSSSAYAQNLSTTTLDPILVTPNRISLTANDTLAATTVLTREDIESRQPQDLPDLLDEVNGIHLTRSGGRGQPVSLFTRGTNSDHTLVLIDGMRLNEATNGSTNLQHIPLNQIDRIEVVRGPRASLYGADAIGGVIQIFTRQPQTSARGSLGSNSLSDAGVGFGLSSEKSSLGIRANTFSSRGYDAKTTGDSDDDGYDEKSVAVSGRYGVNDSAAIDFKSMRSEGTVEFDNGSTDFRNQTAFIGLNHRMRRNRMLEVRLGQATDERQTNDDDFGDSFNRTTRNEATVKGTASSTAYATSFGVDYYDDDVDTNGDYAETSRDNLGVFAQYQWFYGPWDLQVALRRDDNEAYGAQNTGSAAIGRSFGSDHNAFLSYGTAFKAPSFNDLYNETRGPANPDLVPETSETTELGWQTQSGAMSFTGSLYYTDAKNLIEGFNPPENIGAARIRGVELGFEISEQNWRLGAELTLQDAIDKSDGSDLPKRPGRSAVLAAGRSFGPWEVNGQWKFVDKTGGGEFSTVPSYHVIGTNLRYQLAPAWQLAVSIDNVLDREYETTPNFPAPERMAMLTLEWQPE